MPFQYPEGFFKPLDRRSHEIRLLEIRQAPPESDLDCDLITCSLFFPPDYDALSYCWGQGLETTNIAIGNWQIPVTKNLAAALKQLRRIHVSRLWVDALCISQEDDQERSDQIRHICQIYTQAHTTYAWLGDAGSDNAATGMQLLEVAAANPSPISTSRSNNAHDMDVTNAHATLPIGLTQAENSKVDVPHDISEDERADNLQLVEALLSREYWKRRWIVQEVAVSRKVLFCCGTQTLDLDTMSRALDLRQDDLRQHAKKLPYDSLNSNAGFKSIKSILAFRERFHTGNKPSLCETMIRTRSFLSSRVHDNIFAVLGFCADGAEMVPIPSYSQSIKSLLTSLTRQMIRRQMCLDLILVDDRDRSLESPLPSWVPDFLSPSVRLDLYTAAMERKSQTHSFITESLQHDPHELLLQGAVLGTIAKCTSPLGLPEVLEEDARPPPSVNPGCDQIEKDYYGRRSRTVTAAIVQVLLMPLLTWDLLDSNGMKLDFFEANAAQFVHMPTSSAICGLIYYLRNHKRHDGSRVTPVVKWQTWLRKNEDFEVHGVRLESRMRLSVFMLSTYFHIHSPRSAYILCGPLPGGLVLLLPIVLYAMVKVRTYLALDVAISSALAVLGIWRILAGIHTCIGIHYRRPYALRRAVRIEHEPRRLAICTIGLIAATCPGASVGDLICFVAGCKTAVVLRPLGLPGRNQPRYKLIGKAYAELSNADRKKYRALTMDLRPCESIYAINDRKYGRLVEEHQREEWWRRFRVV